MSGYVRATCLGLCAVLGAFAEDAVTEAAARERFAGYLEKEHPGWSIDTFQQILREGDDLSEVRREFTVYRATSTSKDASPGSFVVLFDGLGEMLVWDGKDRVPVLRTILDRCGLLATDEASVRRAGLVCLLMPVENRYDAERVEVKGHVFTYHRHLLVLMSGRVGTYSEDVVVRFDEHGRLETYEVTGCDDLTVEQRDELTNDPDPWLQVVGFVPDELKAKVAEKSRERKLPINHERK